MKQQQRGNECVEDKTMAVRQINANDITPETSGQIEHPHVGDYDLRKGCSQCSATFGREVSLSSPDDLPGAQAKIAQEGNTGHWMFDDLRHEFLCPIHAQYEERLRRGVVDAYNHRKQQLAANLDSDGNVINPNVEKEARIALRDLEDQILRDYPELLGVLQIKPSE